ncbi:hypothetical protein JOE51_008785 [Bradyrhizobium japonicum]|nr:hypothetical protein [Bradyrhizobium japonicum]
MKTASEAKRRISDHLSALGMSLADVREWDLHIDADDGGGSTVFVYYSWTGGGHVSSFEWPWDVATFDAVAYERCFSGKRLVQQ